MLNYYEIQNPNPQLEILIRTLQDLSQAGELTITKEGLDRLSVTILSHYHLHSDCHDEDYDEDDYD